MSRRIWIPALVVALNSVMLQPHRAACQTSGNETSAPPPATAQASAQPASSAPANDSSSAPTQNAAHSPRPPRRYKSPTLDERVQRLAKALDLTESQQAGLKSVLEGQQRKARQIQFSQSLSGADRIGQFRALQEDTVARIRALLNDEQKKKYDPLNHEHQMNSPPPSVEDWLKATQHK